MYAVRNVLSPVSLFARTSTAVTDLSRDDEFITEEHRAGRLSSVQRSWLSVALSEIEGVANVVLDFFRHRLEVFL